MKENNIVNPIRRTSNPRLSKQISTNKDDMPTKANTPAKLIYQLTGKPYKYIYINDKLHLVNMKYLEYLMNKEKSKLVDILFTQIKKDPNKYKIIIEDYIEYQFMNMRDYLKYINEEFKEKLEELISMEDFLKRIFDKFPGIDDSEDKIKVTPSLINELNNISRSKLPPPDILKINPEKKYQENIKRRTYEEDIMLENKQQLAKKSKSKRKKSKRKSKSKKSKRKSKRKKSFKRYRRK
ncbi:MAG: hypothetical protein CMG26_06800 [Candidatus Marinimicrobia bacterium]|nr:hypothetical protein [Candidatus Neomarinimicrobiota bacterium]